MTRAHIADGQQIALLSLEELASDQGLEVLDAEFGAVVGEELVLRIVFDGHENRCVCPFPEYDLREADAASIRMHLRDGLREFAADAEVAGTGPPTSLLERLEATL